MKRNRSDTNSYAAVILVGGPTGATQFRPLSLDIPKPLFPIGGKPMIYHHIAACAKVEGLDEVFLIGDFDEGVFSQFISDVTKEFNLRITFLKEVKPLGTAGGLMLYKQKIFENHKYIFVLHSDVCCSFPLTDLLESHKNHNSALITMMGTKIDATAAPTYGCYVADESGKMLHYAEHPESFISDTINAGLYVFSPEALNLNIKTESALRFSGVGGDTDQEDKSGLVSMERDVLPSLVVDGKVFVYAYKDFWRSIKNAGGAVFANKMYLQWYSKVKPDILKVPSTVKCEIEGQVVIDPTADIAPTARIGPNVYIGPNTKIGRGVRISNSIILNNVIIKEAACVLYSIVAEDCNVGKWTRVEGIPAAGGATADVGSDRFRRQGITMFGKGVTANSEIIVRNCIVMPHKGISRSVCNEILL